MVALSNVPESTLAFPELQVTYNIAARLSRTSSTDFFGGALSCGEKLKVFVRCHKDDLVRKTHYNLPLLGRHGNVFLFQSGPIIVCTRENNYEKGI